MSSDGAGRHTGWFVMLYLGGVLAAFMLAAVLHVLLSAQL